jgi:hypothetical protein
VFCLWDLARFLVLLLVSSASAFAQDPGWPRKLEKPGGTVIVYQPQVDEWKDYATITMRVAFQLTPIGGKQVIGAATMMGNTNVDGVRWHVQEQDELERHQVIEKPYVAASVDVELEKTHRICSSAPDADASPGLLDWAKGGAATRQPNSRHTRALVAKNLTLTVRAVACSYRLRESRMALFQLRPSPQLRCASRVFACGLAPEQAVTLLLVGRGF